MHEDSRVSIIFEEIIEIGAPSDAQRLSEGTIKTRRLLPEIHGEGLKGSIRAH